MKERARGSLRAVAGFFALALMLPACGRGGVPVYRSAGIEVGEVAHRDVFEVQVDVGNAGATGPGWCVVLVRAEEEGVIAVEIVEVDLAGSMAGSTRAHLGGEPKSPVEFEFRCPGDGRLLGELGASINEELDPSVWYDPSPIIVGGARERDHSGGTRHPSTASQQ